MKQHLMDSENISISSEDLDTGILYHFIIPVWHAELILANSNGEVLKFEYGYFYPKIEENTISVRYFSGGTASFNLNEFLKQIQTRLLDSELKDN